MTLPQDIVAIEGVYGPDALRQAMNAWEYLVGHDEITIDVILKTHKILMREQPLMPDEKGYLRMVDVFVGMEKMVPPHLLDAFLRGWIGDMNAGEKGWKELHVAYEKIHPFVDGNGRTGRMFLNWYRIKKYGGKVLIITEARKEDYYQWFS